MLFGDGETLGKAGFLKRSLRKKEGKRRQRLLQGTIRRRGLMSGGKKKRGAVRQKMLFTWDIHGGKGGRGGGGKGIR